MKKEQVFICVTQVRSLRPKSRSDWQVTERVEFVDQVRRKHVQTAMAVGDYINRKMIIGTGKVESYEKFEEYVRAKYPKQMGQLDEFFRPETVEPEVIEESPPVTVEGDNVVVK